MMHFCYTLYNEDNITSNIELQMSNIKLLIMHGYIKGTVSQMTNWSTSFK